MELRDEGQILAEMKGEFLSQYVYSFKQSNRDITNLSYAGIKEAIRRRGHFQIIEQEVTEVNGKIRALVKIHDLVNDIDVLGASEAEAEKPFAYVLAVNKAERNAYAKLIPAKFFAELIAEKLKGQTRPVNVTPSPEKKQDEVPLYYRFEAELGNPTIQATLIIDETSDGLVIRTKASLEKEDFKHVCQTVKALGGTDYSFENKQWLIPQKK